MRVPSPMLFTVPDGRELETWVVGPPTNGTLIFIHGSPGAGLPDPAAVDEATERGLRWVSWSRPGYAVESFGLIADELLRPGAAPRSLGTATA